MQKLASNKWSKTVLAWILVISMIFPTVLSVFDAEAADTIDYNSMSMKEIFDSEESLTWLFAGDSITHNTWFAQGMNGYAEWFEQYLYDTGRGDDSVVITAWGGANVYDFQPEASTVGTNGATKDPGMGLENMITNYNPDVLFIKLGMNDRGKTETNIRQYYNAILDDVYRYAEEKIPKIVLISPTPLSGESAYDIDANLADANLDSTYRFSVIQKEIANERGLLFCNLWEAFTNEALVVGDDYARYFFSDSTDGGIHPNAGGQYLIFKSLSKTLGIYDENKAIYQLEYEDIINAALYAGSTEGIDYDGDYSTVLGDDGEMNKTMPTISSAELLASVDFNSSKEHADGTFNGSTTYANADRIDLTNADVMDDELTLQEVQTIGKEYSIVFRAKLGDIGWRNQPVFALRKTGAVKWQNSIFIAVPGTASTASNDYVDNIYYKYLSGSTSQTSDTAYEHKMSSNASPSIDGNWHTFAIVQSEDAFTYYIDGKAYYTENIKITGSSIGDFFANESTFQAYVGSFASDQNANRNLKGSMDYYQFYKGALSTADIALLSTVTDDTAEMNKTMQVLDETAPIASVDFTSENGDLDMYGKEGFLISEGEVTDGFNPLTKTEAAGLEQDFSVVFRARLKTPYNANQPVLFVSADGTANWDNAMVLGVPGKQQQLYYSFLSGDVSYINRPTNAISVNGTTIAGDNQWHTVAVVNDGGEFSYYVDGTCIGNATGYTLATEGTTIGAAFENAVNFVAQIGRYGISSDATTYILNGYFDYWQLYSSVLTATDVATLSGTVVETTDEDEINKTMPRLSEVEILASVDLNSTNGTFNGSTTYADATRIDMTDANVMDDELTLSEVQNIGKEYSIVFRARLGDMGWRNQPVFALRKTGATGWADSIFIGVPGSARTDDFVDNLYYKYLIGGTAAANSQLSDTGAAYKMSSNASPSIDGNWHTFAIVQSEDAFTYYIDGKAYYTKDITITGSSIGDFFKNESTLQAYVGSFDSDKNKQYNLKGSMDYYQFYKGALNAEQVAELAATTTESASWEEVFEENSVWIVAGAEQMSGYEGPMVNRSLFRLMENVMRAGDNTIAGHRDKRMINVANAGYTVEKLNNEFDAIIGKYDSNTKFDNTVFLLLPEVSEVYHANYEHLSKNVSDYKANIESILSKSQADVKVLWTPFASSDTTINGYINEYAAVVREIAASDSSILLFDANKFMNDNMTKEGNEDLLRNWFETEMYISPMCATDVIRAFYTELGNEDVSLIRVSNTNLRYEEDNRVFKGDYIKDYIVADWNVVDSTKIQLDVSSIMQEYSPDLTNLRFAVMPGVDAGNYHKDIYWIDMDKVTVEGDIYTFEAPCDNPVLAIYGDINDKIYRFKDLEIKVETDAELPTPEITEVALNSLQVVGAPALLFNKDTRTYDVTLYQYQRNVQILAEAAEGLTINVNGIEVKSGERSATIAVGDAATVQVTVSGIVTGSETEESVTYTLNLTRPEYADIIITEVMSDGYQLQREGLDGYELIEIYNASGKDLDLRDYSIGFKRDHVNHSLDSEEAKELYPYYFAGNETAFQSRSNANASYTGINEITKYSSFWDNGNVDTDVAIPFPANSTMVIWVKYARQESDNQTVSALTYDTLRKTLEEHAFAENQKTLTVDVEGTETAVVPELSQLVVAEVPYGTYAGNQKNRADAKVESSNFLLEAPKYANAGYTTRSWLFVLGPGAEFDTDGAITADGDDIISAARYYAFGSFMKDSVTGANLSSADKLSSVFSYDTEKGLALVKNYNYWDESTDGTGVTSDVQGYNNLTSFGAIEYWQKPADTADKTAPKVEECVLKEGIRLNITDDTDVRYLTMNVRIGSDGEVTTITKDLVLEAGVKNAGVSKDITSYIYNYEIEVPEEEELYYWGTIVDGNGNEVSFGNADVAKDTDCEYKVEKYDDISKYRGAKNTAPTLKGYLFAGWFTDQRCTAETALGTDVESGTAYAKFVPAHVFDVKAQISSNLIDDDTTNDREGAIRFVTSVDTLDYSEIGFEYAYNEKTGVSSSNTVYKQLYAVDGTKKILAYTPSNLFCAKSQYFKACTFVEIPSSGFNTEITVTPFWITLDGTTVYGNPVTKTISQGIQ